LRAFANSALSSLSKFQAITQPSKAGVRTAQCESYRNPGHSLVSVNEWTISWPKNDIDLETEQSVPVAFLDLAASSTPHQWPAACPRYGVARTILVYSSLEAMRGLEASPRKSGGIRIRLQISDVLATQPNATLTETWYVHVPGTYMLLMKLAPPRLRPRAERRPSYFSHLRISSSQQRQAYHRVQNSADGGFDTLPCLPSAVKAQGESLSTAKWPRRRPFNDGSRG
jgi:hypothetical protein